MGELSALRRRLDGLLPGTGGALTEEDETGARTLDLSGRGLTADHITRLTVVSDLAPLHALILDDNPVGVAGAMSVVQARQLQHLHTLSLRRCGVSDAVVQVLSAAPGRASLRVLRLAGNGLTDAAVRALTTSRHLRRLVSLDLSDNPITDTGARHLAASPGVRDLRHLDVSGCGLTAYGEKLLFYSHSLHFSIRTRFDPARNR